MLIPYTKKFLKSNLKRFYFEYRLNFKSEMPVVVYQMGKVGSSSIFKSLAKQLRLPVLHVHRMNLQNIDAVAREYKSAGMVPPDETPGIFLNKNIVLKKRPAKFISLVREPIERNMSAFFQNYERFMGSKYKEGPIDIDKLVNRFLNEYSHNVPLTWFDYEMKKVLDIDIFQYPFPFEKGYITVQAPPFDLLVIKLETEDWVKEEAVKKFLQLNDFKLYHHNIGQQKEYARTYNEFKKNIHFPLEYIGRMCESKYMKHFYSSLEIEVIMKKWTS